MVKNTGGNKSKKLASKSFNTSNKTTRFSANIYELYAIVNKMMGGNICEVFCIDGITRTCIIRRKFSGKGRRDNWLSKGKWILVGLREWETVNKEKNKCDLLEVYNDTDKEKLIKSSKDNFEVFLSAANSIENVENDNIEFTNNIKQDIFDSNSDPGSDPGSDSGSDPDNPDWLDYTSTEIKSYNDNDSKINKEINYIISQTDSINVDDI
jgi:initiation factor 1A